MAAGHVVAFGVAAALSVATGLSGALLCGSQFTRSRRLLEHGSAVTARVVEAIPRQAAGQSFPTDSARIIVEYEIGQQTHRETILLTHSAADRYRVGDLIDVRASCGRAPHVRTADEPNIAYGTVEQIAGAVLVILAALPLFIMFSVHALTP